MDQVAYVIRHGSRYPDGGAYAQWVALYEKVRDAALLEGSGEESMLMYGSRSKQPISRRQENWLS